MAADVDVVGARIVLPDRIVEGDLIVRDGLVAEVGTRRGARKRRVDAAGRYVLAGRVDTHVHMREPGHPHREDFATATRAAAAGGTTTVLEMPGGVPAVDSAAALESKRDLLAGRGHVDFALYGGAGKSNLDRIREQAAAGAVAFKSFMNKPAPGADPGTASRCLPDDAVFLEAMAEIAASGRVGVIHAENDDICSALAARAIAAGAVGPLDHAHSRPPVTEEEAVRRAIVLAAQAGAPISFAHISTAAAVQAIREAKARGLSVTAEACPHHLLLTEDDLARVGAYGKINPPLRPVADRQALWKGLREGVIDFIGTDHAPYTVEEKERGRERIFDAPSGAHGVQTCFALMLTEVNAGRLTLPELTRIISGNAARRFGLWPKKGEIRVGSDADFVLVDLDRRDVIDRSRLDSVSRDAARLWDGRPTHGAVEATFIRGCRVYAEGTIQVAPGFGRFLSPAESSARS